MPRDSTHSARPRRLIVLGVVTLAVLAATSAWLVHHAGAQTPHLRFRAELHPQAGWAPCNRNAGKRAPSTFKPLTDRAAALLVTPEPETRPDNDKPFRIGAVLHPAPNVYRPTATQLRAFRGSRTSLNQPALGFNPYFRHVDGLDGLHDPTTDELIQWAAHKWGIPENWLRAEYVLESNWSMWQLGDDTPVTKAAYTEYPLQARIPGVLRVYQSLGIAQVRWAPDGSVNVGADPLRWESEAFNIDYQASMLRLFYDDPDAARTAWGDKTYAPCEKWNSVGAWFSSYPWLNSGQEQYIKTVQQLLADRAWRSPDFLAWTLPTLPAAVTLK
jgi:hypothetical protein